MRRPPWLTRNVVALGLVSLLTDAATEMAMPLLPAFLTRVLGAGALALGTIEGAADGVASVLKLLSGRWADRLGRHRPFVLAGYSISTVVRPLLALAATPAHVLAVRLGDRVGKGLRSSPRDALLASSVPLPGDRGAAFGFHRAMDHAGAVVGPLLAVGVLTLLTSDLRVLFALTAVPGLAAVAVLAVGVREPEAAPPREATAAVAAPPPPPAPAAARGAGAPRALARFLVPLGLFRLAAASDVFLLLAVSGEQDGLTRLPLLWMGLHLVRSILSTPGGRLADRWGRRRVIAAGWLAHAGVFAGMALASSPEVTTALVLAAGVPPALFEGAEKALVADLAPAGRRGTGFGWYHLTQGLLAVAASVLFGGIWEAWGRPTAFGAGAATAALAVVALAAGARATATSAPSA